MFLFRGPNHGEVVRISSEDTGYIAEKDGTRTAYSIRKLGIAKGDAVNLYYIGTPCDETGYDLMASELAHDVYIVLRESGVMGEVKVPDHA